MSASMKIMGKPCGFLAIPMRILSEQQAKHNHNQTLERLNERGGVGVEEAAALVEEKGLDFVRSVTQIEAVRIISRAISKNTGAF